MRSRLNRRAQGEDGAVAVGKFGFRFLGAYRCLDANKLPGVEVLRYQRKLPLCFLKLADDRFPFCAHILRLIYIQPGNDS
jgi:hypothetical protein